MKESSDLEAALVGRYAIEREIGAGGMATVYLAHDVRHGRKVAVKVLRPDLAAALGPDRFHREIQIAAQLQHPHILPLLDSGEAEGFLYYVMPYVEGESLRDKLAREGELPVGEAVRILRDVVDALTEAHAHGVVHRDIKPDNIMLRGRHALVMDFGVAKAVSEATDRQTITTAGVALGTPAYMAPEQASANPHIDHRADIYAVGSVAYELLAGRPVFMGTTPQAVLGAHVTEAPDPLRKHREAVPEALEKIVMRCLEKKPADRWQHADELLQQLEALATPSGGITPTQTQPVRGVAMGARRWVGLGVGIAAAAGAIMVVTTRGPRSASTIVLGDQVQVTLEPGLEMDPALSPDGRLVAYAAGPPTRMRIYVRPVTGGDPVPISEGALGSHRYPRWAPDGSQVLFTAWGQLWTVPPLGGTVRPVISLDSADVSYGSWSPDGESIVYAQLNTQGESRIVTSGIDGTDRRELARGANLHSPDWSPDGRFVAYVGGNSLYWYGGVLGNLGPSEVWVVRADGSGDPHPVTGGRHLHGSPAWMPDGRTLLLVSTRAGGLDVFQITLNDRGEVVDSLRKVTTGLRAGSVTASADGRRIVYSVLTNTSNVWSIDVTGDLPVSNREAVPVTTGTQHVEGLDVSIDGRWLAFDSDRGGNVDIYKMELPDGSPTQLTTDPADDFIPAFSPDGRQIAFHSWRTGSRDVFVMSADGTGLEQVTDNDAMDSYADWSPDGSTLLFQSDRTGEYHLYSTRRSGAGWSPEEQLTSRAVSGPIESGGASAQGKWSPDGRYIASVGLRVLEVETGEESDILAPFEHEGHRVTPMGVAWPPDGRRIYFKGVNDEGQASFWSIAPTGGTPTLLVEFDDPSRPFGRNEFTTDGKRIYFTIDNRQSDLWAVEVLSGGQR